jgi:histone deacetylase 1/2
MPPSFWAEALSTATYLLNRRPCRATGDQTPFQRLLGAPPTLDHLRVFGCLCFPNQAATSPHKLAARSTACVFLGYPNDHCGYRCFEIATRRVITSRHVTFDEHSFPFRSAMSEQSPSRVTVHYPATDAILIQTPPPAIQAPPAAPTPPTGQPRGSEIVSSPPASLQFTTQSSMDTRSVAPST